MNRKIVLCLAACCAISFFAHTGGSTQYQETISSGKPKGIDVAAIPQVIQSFIKQKYPGAVIRKYEKEGNNRTEVDVMHDGKRKEVYFDGQNQWLATEWEIRSEEVPSVVMIELVNSAYADYDVEEIDAIEKPSGLFYTFELKQFNNEVNLMFDSQGQLIK